MDVCSMNFIKGMTWGWVGVRGTWQTEEAAKSIHEMARVGVNWTAVAFSGYQAHPQATEIVFDEDPTVTDEELKWAIRESHKNGLQVCLKPVVNCTNGVWRAHIGFFDHEVPGEPSWTQWFASYEKFIIHYAVLAEEMKCEMFCIGCEMVQTDKRESEWRHLILKVREVYSGLITYNCDKYQEERVLWWDAVDIVSSSGYYSIDKWDARVEELEKWIQPINKPFFFMETGCPSRKGSSYVPNDWGHSGEVDLDEQANYYEVMFAKLNEKSWFYGYMLWDWPAKLYTEAEAASNNDYCIYRKKAEHVVRDYYNGVRK
jgi:hypothetical protein